MTRDSTFTAIGQSHHAAVEQNTGVSHAESWTVGQMSGQTSVW